VTPAIALLMTLATAPPVHAERFVVELRVIEGVPGEGKQVVDPKLHTFAKDLKVLPFKELRLIDSHTTSVRGGERISLEIPSGRGAKAGKQRFLQVAAHGRQVGGKLRFQLSIDAIKFDTLVAVPDGGTIFVAVPRSPKNGSGPAMLFAFTARSQT
jgi:hypothetical protein